jgi:hypothetical protein
MTTYDTKTPFLDEPGLRRKMAAARPEMPNGPIVPSRWNARRRRMRPRFVTASVIVAVSTATILATAIAAATTTLSVVPIMAVGALSILFTLTSLYATWPTTRRASPIPRIVFGVAAGAALFAAAAATLDFAA